MDIRSILIVLVVSLFCGASQAERVAEPLVRAAVVAPYSVGEPTDIEGVWELLNGSGALGGYVIETGVLAPLPGFSGAVIDMLVTVDLSGGFIDVELINHNEPIFVSGLGEQPFRGFLEQYRGHSLNDALVVGRQRVADTGALVYLDGVTKATASVRIAHESILGAAREVARQKFQGLAASNVRVTPSPDLSPALQWSDLVEQGMAQHFVATHAEVQALFEGTVWVDDSQFADEPQDEHYIDLWLVDVSPTASARAVMSERMFKEWSQLRRVSPEEQTLLLIESGQHGLVTDDFIRNTSPPLIRAVQSKLPLSLQDADLLIDLNDEVPEGQSMVLRIDRRQGFNPIEPWNIELLATRQHGIFRPEQGHVALSWETVANPNYYTVETPAKPLGPFAGAVVERATDIAVLVVLLGMCIAALVFNTRLVEWKHWRYLRWSLLLGTLGFIGWWGQGQLSIVTPLAVISAISQGRSLSFLLYDPFSLLIWIVSIASFLFWGRALFCGWLCPFGVLQELMEKIAVALHIPKIKPNARWDKGLRKLKYVVLLWLLAVVFVAPTRIDQFAEVEPFKTAISVFFVREWYFVLYAVLCLLASAFIFKAYCRYLCPLGALMSLGGRLMRGNWIERRSDCGSPCQLCKVQCAYGAIDKSGEIEYDECFGCLDCVDIYKDEKRCVPLVLENKRGARHIVGQSKTNNGLVGEIHAIDI